MNESFFTPNPLRSILSSIFILIACFANGQDWKYLSETDDIFFYPDDSIVYKIEIDRPVNIFFHISKGNMSKKMEVLYRTSSNKVIRKIGPIIIERKTIKTDFYYKAVEFSEYKDSSLLNDIEKKINETISLLQITDKTMFKGMYVISLQKYINEKQILRQKINLRDTLARNLNVPGFEFVTFLNDRLKLEEVFNEFIGELPNGGYLFDGYWAIHHNKKNRRYFQFNFLSR